MLMLIGCKGEFISDSVKQSYESVMKVHDEVMPEMTTINKLKRSIKKKGTKSEENLDMMKQLEDANEGMMKWMSEFKLDKSATEKEQLDYLSQEQVRINKVSSDMKTSIVDAKSLLTTLK